MPAGHKSHLSKDKSCFILYEAAAMRTPTNLSQTITIISGTPYSQSDALRPFIQRYTARWHCAARREIAERSEEAPEAEAAQPSRNGGIWKALKGQPVGVEMYDKPSGVVRGECRGGLGGAAAPNRPPSAARRAGGPN